MNQPRQYVDSLLEAISNEPFSSEDDRELLLKIKAHLLEAPDLAQELRELYKVERFDEFALSLMWALKQGERAPSESQPDSEDQYLVSMKFRSAIAGEPPSTEIEEPEPEAAQEAEPPAASEPEAAQEAEPPTASEPEAAQEAESPAAPEPSPGQAAEERPAVSYDSNAPEETFPELLDKFVIAMQAGVDDRTRLLEAVMRSAGEIGQPESDYSSDLQEFCSKLTVFLEYVKGKDFMDDVRTMNILSSVSDAIGAWSNASIESRSGLLSEGIRVLSDAQSHYE